MRWGCELNCYQIKHGSTLLLHSKANLLTLGFNEGKYSVYCRHQARRTGNSCSEDLNSWMACSKFLKVTLGVREWVSVNGQLVHNSLIGW